VGGKRHTPDALQKYSRPADRPPPRPLTASEWSRCARVGARLQSELRELCLSVPDRARTTRGLAEYLSVGRNICQRVTAAVKIAGTPVQVLVQMPGMPGLLIFVAGFRERGGDESLARAMGAALDDFKELVADLGGSRARLLARIEITSPTEFSSPDAQLAMRRQRFEADVALHESESAGRVVVDAYRPLPGDPESFEHAYLGGDVGVRDRPGGVPFLISHVIRSNADEPPRVFSLDGVPLSADPAGQVLEKFTSRPVPKLTTKGTELEGFYFIDHEKSGNGPLDLFIGRLASPAAPHPRTAPPHLLTRNIVLRVPTRYLIFDTYMHASMAAESVPSLGAHVRSPASGDVVAAWRWFDRLPSSPQLQSLGRGIEQASCALYPRSSELTAHLFDRLGWAADEFVGFRCLVEYPIAGVEYAISFDFS
jgi:hypothetical protein